MLKRIKLLKQWETHAVGTELDVDQKTADELVANGTAQVVEKVAPAPAAQPDQTAISAMVEKAVKDGLSNVSLARKSVHIEVKDMSDDDPWFGYNPLGKSAKDLTKEEKLHCAGLQLKDLHKAADSVRHGGRVPERLMKCEARSREIVQKAAGDGMVVTDDEYGGYLIAPAAVELIQRRTVEVGIIRPRAAKINMTTRMLTAPMVRDENRTSGQIYQGIQVLWEDELSQLSSSRPKLEGRTWVLKKIAALGYVSGEFEKWAPVTAGSFLIPKFGEGIAYKEDLGFINGKGGGQPLGLMQCGAKIEITKETGQNADTFVLENSTKMRARVRVLDGANLVWLMNQMLWTQLPKLNVNTGASGTIVFIQTAADGLGQRLWGIPIQFTEKVPALGDAGDVCLIDASDYVIADDTSGPAIATSIHMKFDYDQSCFRVIKYVDGQNLTQTAFTPYIAGSTTPDTLSPVITLGART